jgi:Helix-turn-helix domain
VKTELGEALDAFNSQQAAHFLHIAEKTLRTWRSEKRGPKYYTLGDRVFYSRAALEEFVQAATQEPQAS